MVRIQSDLSARWAPDIGLKARGDWNDTIKIILSISVHWEMQTAFKDFKTFYFHIAG